MNISKVTYKRLVTKDYCNLEVGVEVEVEKEDCPVESYKKAKRFVDARIGKSEVDLDDLPF